jgi:hypothetical protein
MLMTTKYYDLVELIWKDANVTLKVAEMVKGEPNGLIGLPLIVDERSTLFEVTFLGVVEFKSVLEAFFQRDGEIHEINDFVWEAANSEYRKTVSCFGPGISMYTLKHLCLKF